MATKTEIKKVLYRFLQDGISSDDAAQQVLDLFSVEIINEKTNDSNIKLLKEFQDFYNNQPAGVCEGEFDGYLADSTIELFLNNQTQLK